MLDKAFVDVYTKFKLHFYQRACAIFQDRDASLTTVEVFCVEVIHALKSPTINEFASYLNISSSNAAYKISSLIHKGHIRKIRSEQDRREYHLQVTEKFFKYYNLSVSYVQTVSERIRQRFSPEEVSTLTRMLEVISEELMPEVAPEKG